MLTYSEITQLSDKDLADELENSRNSLFRQKMGVKTTHLKDAHLIKALKRYVAQLLTELTRRRSLGEKVEKTSADVAKKTKEMHTEIEKAQEAKKAKKTAKKAEEKEEEAEEKIEEKESKDVKVKKVEKKGILKKVFSKKEKEEKESK